MGLIGIFGAIILIMILAYHGWSTIWIAPIAAALVALTGGLNLLDMYKGPYMQGFIGFTGNWFPVFMLGAIFGKLMDATGMAQAIAVGISKLFGPKNAVLAVVIAGSILTYGGVSMFVCVFCLYPICVVLFREANTPRRLIPACITVGVFAYTMVCIPGTPQIQNLIPTQYFGTTPMAAPWVGIIAGIVMGGGGTIYMMWRQKRVAAKGEVFTEPPGFIPEPYDKLPNIWLSAVPLVMVVVTLNLLKWDIIVSLLAAIVFILVANTAKYRTFVEAINEGAKGAMLPIIGVSAINGFGKVVTTVPAFEQLTDMVTRIPGSPLISLAVATNVLCGATGSASGGLGLTLTALAPKYIEIAALQNIPVEVMHRVAAIAASCMDTVPHNGAILTLLAVCGMTHKASYRDIFVCTIIMPFFGTVAAIIAYDVFGIV